MDLGAHMSIAGGIHLACGRGRAVGANVIQVFTKNERQWKAKPLTDEDARLFREARKEHRIREVLAHDTYLINLASPKDDLWKKSLDAFVHEVERCEMLGIPYLVTHPGAPGDSGEEAGIRRMIKGLNETHKRTRGFAAKVLLETTAGQGTVLGWKFEQLKAMRDGLKEPERMGFCFDTCHTFAAGYDHRTKAKYNAVMEEFDRLLGVKSILAFHLNDSKRELGSRVDRHDHIGQGQIGLGTFRWLLNDRRFAKITKVLETPKEGNMDRLNLKKLRALRKKKKK
ncbi:MAG: deoxyribonuclease IV [Planctomycetota bacterium]|jgi:deoxyribonuclease-4